MRNVSYKGFLIGFRSKIDDHPTENTSVCMFQIKTVHRLSLWGQEINKATKHDIEYLLKSNNVKYKYLQKHVLTCLNQELQFTFNSYDILDKVYFEN